MKYSLEFKIECAQKYLRNEYISTPGKTYMQNNMIKYIVKYIFDHDICIVWKKLGKKHVDQIIPRNVFSVKADEVNAIIDSGTVNAVSERVFSEICFGDSKRFENRLRQVLLAVMRKYFSSEMTDAELLRSIGISRYPEPLELRGNIIVNSNRMITLKCGFCVYSNEIEDIQLSPGPDVTRIITIENRANYFAYRQSDNELVVYHGGHFSPAKKMLFLKLAAAMPEKCIWYHWGDIDFGGFSMLMRLRSEILASIRPYRMNREELVSYSDYTRPFQQEYAQKLRALAEHPLLSDCKECLEYMIKNSVKLEQEAMLT